MSLIKVKPMTGGTGKTSRAEYGKRSGKLPRYYVTLLDTCETHVAIVERRTGKIVETVSVADLDNPHEAHTRCKSWNRKPRAK